MVLMTSYLDLSITENQILVAQDWFIYQYKVIISEEIRHQIEETTDDYHEGIITHNEMYNSILNRVKLEFKAQKN